MPSLDMEGDIMEDFLGIYWAGVDKIVALPIFLILIFFSIKNYLKVREAALLLTHRLTRSVVFKNFVLYKFFIKMLCLATSIFIVFLAFMRPQWDKKNQNIIQEGRDVLILLDISRSMLAQDFKPSRLEFAKLKIQKLLTQIFADRAGLIVYSGSAFLQCPLTNDHSAFKNFLDFVDVETISTGTTAVDKALAKAIEVFVNSPERKNRLLFLITDGEDFSHNLSLIQERAQELSVRLFALGMATEQGAPIPILDRDGNMIGHEKEGDKIVLSKLNEKLLKQMCNVMQGEYVRACYDDSDVDSIARRIKQFEKEKFSDRDITLYEEKYPWFLGVAWVLLLVEWLL
jgi:Ca-activated chloride channel homolog